MSVFSILKRGRQAAKEHAAKQAEKQKAEEEKTPYKHIPRHAAIDALNGGPASFRDTDRPKILEQNRRRSAMTASGVGMGGMTTPHHPGFPRVNSALSHVSYPSAYASPVVQLPRAYSYAGGVHPGWNNQGGEVVYSQVEPNSFTSSIKGKEVERVMVDSGRASRSSSKANSPVSSSSTSTSSQDDLEMKAVKHNSGAVATSGASTSSSGTSNSSRGRPTGEGGENLHRLHPSHSRRTSDPSSPNYGAYGKTPFIPQNRGGPRVTSLPATGIPPVPALPPMQFGGSLSQSSVAYPTASATSIATTSSTTVAPKTVASGAPQIPQISAGGAAQIPQIPTGGAPQMSQIPQIPKISTRSSPVRAPVPDEIAGPISFKEVDPNLSVAVGTAVTSSPTQKHKRISKGPKFTELETISSNTWDPPQHNPAPVTIRSEIRTTITSASSLPTRFDEACLGPPREVVLPPPKSGKLNKNTSAASVKPPKKHRWSLRSSKPTAVAG